MRSSHSPISYLLTILGLASILVLSVISLSLDNAPIPMQPKLEPSHPSVAWSVPGENEEFRLPLFTTQDPLPAISGKGEGAELELPMETATWLSFCDLLPFADLFDRGLFLSFVSKRFSLRSDAEKWTGVEIGPEGNGRRMKGRKADIRLFLPESEGYRLRMKVKAEKPGQHLDLGIGDRLVRMSFDKKGWAVYETEFPGPSGYCELRFALDKGKVSPLISWLHFQPSGVSPMVPDTLNDSGDLVFSRMVESGDSPEKCEAMVIPGEGGAVFHLLMPETVRLQWRSRFERKNEGEQVMTFLVRIWADGLEARTLYVKTYSGSSGEGEKLEALNLSEFAGKLVRLEFWSTGGLPDDRLYLTDFGLYNMIPPSEPDRWQPPKNVIVFLSDTLRWDKIHFWKPDDNPIHTPNFDMIASRGVSFVNAISQGNWSKPSQAGIQGGRYPFDMRMDRPEQKRTKDTLLIADAIETECSSVVTASYSSNGYVSSRFGFEQSWDRSRNMIRENLPNKTEYLLKAMFGDWERERLIEQPFFVWLGTIDPHVAYNPRERFLKLYDTKPYNGIVKPFKTAHILGRIKQGKLKLCERDWNRLISLYHGEVSYNDHQFGRLLDKLDQWGILAETAIILISDHGDEFLDHGGMGHGHSVYDELVRVPLIVYYPRGFPRPRIVTDSVETMGIFPTVLEMLGIAEPERTQAESLVPYALGVIPLWPRVGYSYLSSTKYLVAVNDWRLMKIGKKTRLFNSSSDRYQKHDLSGERPEALYYMSMREREWKNKYRP